jgi:non-heme chloroperoxidase
MTHKDWGSGRPIVFSHGWPLSADDWDPQMMFFLLNGYRWPTFAGQRGGRPGPVMAGTPAAP